MKIILTTTSPYRQTAFRFLGLDFIAEGSEVDEQFEGRPEDPKELVKALSQLKAEAVAKNHTAGVVIGFDSVGWLEGKVLEKPKNREEAFARLRAMSGKSHQFFTGICVIDVSGGKTLSRVVGTKAFMRKLSDAEINKYLNQDPNYVTYALGYDPLENYSASFVKKIEGSYNNLTRGIPLEEIIEMLQEIG